MREGEREEKREGEKRGMEEKPVPMEEEENPLEEREERREEKEEEKGEGEKRRKREGCEGEKEREEKFSRDSVCERTIKWSAERVSICVRMYVCVFPTE